MNHLKNFLSLLLEHTGKAFSISTLLLVGAEYLVPGSVLPFLNLYLLGAGAVLLLAAFPGRSVSSKWKTRVLIFSMGHEFNFNQRRLSLPEGDWRLAALKNGYALLKDGVQWLSFKLGSSTPSSNQTRGSWPDWLTSASQPTAIVLNENEVIFWRLDQAPETLWRQSDFVVRATWHRSGLSVFVASKTNVFAFELDSRGGHQITNLVSFDHIYDLSVDQGVLYVAADKNGKHGLWQITLE